MAQGVPELISRQRDFSAGELDPELKRQDDLPIYRAGGRQMRDLRILNSRVAQQRPGRRALYLQSGRIDQIEVTPGLIFDLCFGSDGSWVIRNSAAAVVASHTIPAYPWTGATIGQIVWTKVNIGATRTDVVLTFPGMKPAIASFDGTTWTFLTFAFSVDGAGGALVPFFRVAAPGATMKPSATGAAGASITIEFSANVLLPAHVGALFRFAGRRLRVDAVTDAQHATVTCLDALLKTQELTVAKPDGAIGGTGIEGFSVGQVVRGTASEAEGEVVAVNLGTSKITVQLTNFATGFLISAVGPPIITEIVIGPSGRSKVTGASDVTPLPALSWDEQMFSDARGWPQSCSTDDGRLIFCDLPATPEAVLWSVTNQPYNFNVGPEATDAIIELIAGKPRVYNVCAWTDEIVFTSAGVYYVPINQTNPLKPGSVFFVPISPEAPSTAKPLFTSDGYLYINAGRNRIVAVIATGAALSSRPYSIQDISENHTHLFSGGPLALALTTGDGVNPEKYVYVVNDDGSVVVGKYDSTKQWVGWLPWGGHAVVRWVSALHQVVRFVSEYPRPVGTNASVAEILDDTEYVDGAVLINNVPSAIAPPPGEGPFHWMKSGSIELMDGTRPMGTHAIDGAGFVLPAYQGEDLDIATIVGGVAFTPTFEPFIPTAQPGQDQKQGMIRRNLGRIAVSVRDSTGFVIASLYSGPAGPLLPTPGSVQRQFRIPPWNQGDNAAQAPFLREGTYRQRFSGRAFDQRVVVFKDHPGPLQLVEVAIEASV